MTESKISSAVNSMIQTERMHKHLLDSTVSSIGIHRTHHRILIYISRNNPLSSQKALADHIGVSAAAITGALKKLEADGYVKRVQGSDNRFNNVEITESGRALLESTKALFIAVDTSLFEGFSDDELDGYIAILEKIQSNIKKRIPCAAEGRCYNINEKMV